MLSTLCYYNKDFLIAFLCLDIVATAVFSKRTDVVKLRLNKYVKTVLTHTEQTNTVLSGKQQQKS